VLEIHTHSFEMINLQPYYSVISAINLLHN